MNSENLWPALSRIQDGIGSLREQVGRMEGTIASLASRDEVSQIFDSKISAHSQQCQKRRSSHSIIPRPTDWTPVAKGLGKLLLALAGLIAAAAAVWFGVT